MDLSTPKRITPCRGDIWWVDFPHFESKGSEQEKKRPAIVLSPKPTDVIVVSTDGMNQAIPTCIVVPLSSVVEKQNRHSRILIPETQKVPEPGTKGCSGESLALTEQMRCVSIERFLDTKRVAKLKTEAIAAVEAGIRFVLGMP